MLISDKIDVRTNIITTDKKKRHNDKRINSRKKGQLKI